MFEEVVRYIKDNPEGYWFKAKLWGWGWTPARWQGWVVLAIFILLLLWNGLSIDSNSTSGSVDPTWMLVRVFGAVAILIAICYKTGEKPRWQWGVPEKYRKIKK